MIAKSIKFHGCGFFFALMLVSALPATAQEIQETRDTLGRLIEVKKLIAEEKNNWDVEKQILQDTIDTLSRQVTEIEESLADIEDTTTQAEDQRESLQTEIEELEEVLAVVEPMIENYEKRILAMVDYFPEPLMKKIERLVEQLPQEGERGSRRLLNNRAVVVVGILDEINNFQNSVQVHKLPLDVEGRDDSREYSVLYYGLSSAYFVDENETVAGIGRPAKGGWVYETREGIAPDVYDAVQIKEKRLLARFVQLPTEIQEIEVNK